MASLVSSARPKQTKEEKEEWDQLKSKTTYSDIFVKTRCN